VDDDPSIVLFMRRPLELNGYRVSITSDGETALDKVETENPDLVLLDVGIPAIDGFEVCRRLRDISDVPVIMVKAKSRDEDIVFGLGIGADDHLTKPFSPGVLLARVKALLRRRDLMTNGENALVCGDLSVDLDARKATRGDV
jgi:DNA-binding response OmpR family regulator